MVFIYVLQLKDNKWYIGKTESSKFRIGDIAHFDSNASSFTQKYPPEDIYQIIPECDKYDEDKYVKKYMDKYGIDNVRGGSYSKLELTSNEKELIQKELWSANDLCFLCGGDHFVKDCPHNTENNSFEIDEKEMTDNKDDERMNWIKYYENQLFELTEGYWLRSYCSNYLSQMFHILKKNPNNNTIPDKIFTSYCDPPINFKNIKDIKYVLDDKEINTFKGKLLFNNRHNKPHEYSIHIILEEKTDKRHNCIVYNYVFSKLKYPQLKGDSSFYNDKTKKDLEFKLFMLKNEQMKSNGQYICSGELSESVYEKAYAKAYNACDEFEDEDEEYWGRLNQKYHHITITASGDDGNATTQHFLRKYNEEEYEELEDEDGCVDWEEVMRYNIQIDTVGYHIDMNVEVLIQETYDRLMSKNGWTWVTKE